MINTATVEYATSTDLYDFYPDDDHPRDGHVRYLKAWGAMKITPDPHLAINEDYLDTEVEDDSTVAILPDGSIGVVGNSHVVLRWNGDDDGDVNSNGREAIKSLLTMLSELDRDSYTVEGTLMLESPGNFTVGIAQHEGQYRLSEAKMLLADGTVAPRRLE